MATTPSFLTEVPSGPTLSAVSTDERESHRKEQELLALEEESINETLKSSLNKVSRLFFRRNEAQDDFEVLNEDGLRLFQLQAVTPQAPDKDPINFVLFDDAEDKIQLVKFIGNPGFLGLNGELTAYYAHSMEEKFGFVKQSSPNLCHFSPEVTVFDKHGTPVYEVRDLNKHSILWPCRKCTGVVHQAYLHGSPSHATFARIDERRLLTPTEARNSADLYKAGMRSKLPNTKATLFGTRVVDEKNKVVDTETNGNIQVEVVTAGAGAEGERRSRFKLSTGSVGNRSSLRFSQVEQERPTHNHFCVMFRPSIDFKLKIALVGAHLLVNDDFVRRSKRATRVCYCTSITFGLLTLAASAILITVILITRGWE